MFYFLQRNSFGYLEATVLLFQKKKNMTKTYIQKKNSEILQKLFVNNLINN